jgi:hypothetical protein
MPLPVKGGCLRKKSIFNGSGYRFQVKELWGLCWPCSLQIDWWKVDRGNIGMFLSETKAGSHMSMWLSCCKICYKFGPFSILSTTSNLLVDFNNIFLELRFCSKFHWNSANKIFKTYLHCCYVFYTHQANATINNIIESIKCHTFLGKML